VFACVGWQVTLCDPIWQVTPRRPSSEIMMYVYMYAFILQQDNTQNIKPEGQQGSEALTAARNKKCMDFR